MSDGRWAVVYAKPACEMLAAQTIREAGYRSYCPAMRQRPRHPVSHRPAMIGWQLRPLFPRYLFAELDDAGGGAAAIMHCTGVADLLRRDCGLAIATLPGDAIEELRERERALEFDDPSTAPRFLPQPGQQVRIVGGPWSRMLGEVAALDDAGRVAVLLDLMRRRVRAWIPAEMLALA